LFTAATASAVQVKCTIWDTAGQERFRALTSTFYRGAKGIIFGEQLWQQQLWQQVSAWADTNPVLQLPVCCLLLSACCTEHQTERSQLNTFCCPAAASPASVVLRLYVVLCTQACSVYSMTGCATLQGLSGS
jgi:hypothetical protein